MLILLILFFGIWSRCIPHAPNFTPVLSLALFGGAYLSRGRAVILPLAMMMLSDLMLGLHDTIIFTWGSILLISFLGLRLRGRVGIRSVGTLSSVSALAFFFITNLGAWPVLYPVTWDGLQQCFWAALPFFRDTLLSTVLYSGLLFGGYEFISNRLSKSRWSGLLQAV